jgi:hypothetical protein
MERPQATSFSIADWGITTDKGGLWDINPRSKSDPTTAATLAINEGLSIIRGREQRTVQ